MSTTTWTPLQIAHSSWVWIAELTRLAAGAAAATDGLAVLRAMSTDAPEGCALQLRYVRGESGDESVRCLLVGRARTSEDGIRLLSLAELTVPNDYALRLVAEDAVRQELTPFSLDEMAPSHVAEIRRINESIDGGLAAVVPWPSAGEATGLSGDLALALAGTHVPVVLCIHVESVTPSSDLLADLTSTINVLRDDLETSQDLHIQRMLAAHRSWLRGLPRAAVEVRIALVSAEPLTPGLCDLVGLSMVGDAPYEVARPSNRHELDLALQMVDECRAGAWGVSTAHDHGGLRFLFEPAGLGSVFRFPDQQSAATRAEARELSCSGAVSLLRTVALEGDGFLVIDLGRGDYAAFAAEMRDAGRPVRRFRLDPAVVGFDPFATPEHAIPAMHASRVLAALDLAHRFSTTAPASWPLLSRAFYDAYGVDSAPDVEDLLGAVDATMARFSLAGPGTHELRAHLCATLSLLDNGPLGAVIAAGAFVDWDELLAHPTIIELGAVAGRQDRLLLAGLLLAGVLSHRDTDPVEPGRRHLLVISGGAALTDAVGAGAAFLSDAMDAATVLGQSFAIATPAATPPTGILLAPDAWSLPLLASSSFSSVPVMSGATS